MSPIRYFAVLMLAVSVFSVPAAAQQSSPKDVTAAFYKFDRSNPQVFNRKNVQARKRWLSTELYGLLLRELDREAEYLKANPGDKPHFGDGLPFQPLAETCQVGNASYGNDYRLGQATEKGDLANVDVEFFYPSACKLPTTLYAVHLVKENGRWVIDDVLYVSDKTTLVEDLQRKTY